MLYMKNIFYNNMNLDFEHLRIVREQDFIFHKAIVFALFYGEKQTPNILFTISISQYITVHWPFHKK